jgi:hypothetical protein
MREIVVFVHLQLDDVIAGLTAVWQQRAPLKGLLCGQHRLGGEPEHT